MTRQLLFGNHAFCEGAIAAGVRFYSTETYAAAFLIYPICAVVALGCALLSRETYCRQQVID